MTCLCASSSLCQSSLCVCVGVRVDSAGGDYTWPFTALFPAVTIAQHEPGHPPPHYHKATQ